MEAYAVLKGYHIVLNTDDPQKRWILLIKDLQCRITIRQVLSALDRKLMQSSTPTRPGGKSAIQISGQH